MNQVSSGAFIRIVWLITFAVLLTLSLVALSSVYPLVMQRLAAAAPSGDLSQPAAPRIADSFPWGQLVLGIFFALFGLLIVEQWRELRRRIETLEQERGAAVAKAAESLKGQIEKFTETETRRLDQMHARLIRIREDHPWIVGLTENDFIPSVPSCRLVMITAKALLQNDKLSLAYEYIYSWLRGSDKVGELEGTIEQYYDLIEFCEDQLRDRHLSLMIYQHINMSVVDRRAILPDYLRYMCITGHWGSALGLFAELRRIAMPSFWRKMRSGSRVHPLMMHPNYAFRAHAALSIYAASDGRYAEDAYHWSEAMRLAQAADVSLGANNFVEWAKVEREVMRGGRARAIDRIEELRGVAVPREFRYLCDMADELGA